MSICIHSWSYMPRRKIHNKHTSVPNIKPQSPNMCGIIRPSQGLIHLQPCNTHGFTGKYGAPHDYDQQSNACMKKRSQDHNRQYWDRHQLQIGCQTRLHHGLSPISVHDDGLFQNTRGWVECPGTKQVSICMQRQLIKINWTTSEPPIWYLQIWHYLWPIMHALCRQQWNCIWIQEW